MTHIFPPELWLRVARFLSPTDLQNLYTVNSLFLELSFNARYEHVVLGDDGLSRAVAIKKMQHYRNPWISHRIRQLEIRISATSEDANVDTAVRTTPYSSHTATNLDVFAENLSRCVLSLPGIHVQRLIISVSYPDPRRSSYRQGDLPRLGFLEHVGEILPFVRHSLLHLHLACPHFIMERLVKSAPVFPLLTSIDFLVPLSQRGRYDDCVRAVSSFLRTNSTRIQKLKLESNCAKAWNLLFEQPLDLPLLAELHLNCTIHPDTQNDAFFRLHAPKITTLVCPMISSFRRTLEVDCAWSRLSALEIDKSNFFPFSDIIWHLFGQICQNLTAFTLKGHLDEPEVEGLLPLLSTRSTGKIFQQLHLEVSKLSVKLVDQLFLCLPDILHLRLDIREVVDENLVAIVPNAAFPFAELIGGASLYETNEFLTEMRRKDYGAWNLQDLTITLQEWSFEMRDVHCWGLLKLFAECIPSIHSFGGSGNTDIPGDYECEVSSRLSFSPFD